MKKITDWCIFEKEVETLITKRCGKQEKGEGQAKADFRENFGSANPFTAFTTFPF